MKQVGMRKLIYVALALALNWVGAFIALSLRLPIYLDTLGTVLAAILFGPLYGAGVALGSALINQLSDPMALFYAPVGILVGILTGLLIQKDMAWRKLLGRVLMVSIPGTLLASLITVILFKGITTSGSSLLVQALHAIGLDLVISSFLVQFVTDYADRLVTIGLVILLFKRKILK